MAQWKETYNETALVSQARCGDVQAVQRLLEAHWNWLKGLAYNVLGNIHEVDDVLQNICLIVLQKIHTVREPERFRPWLATVARHAALAWREQNRKKIVQLADLPAEPKDPAQTGSQMEQMVLREQHDRLLEAVGELPEKYREVFLLKYMEDQSYAQIAEELDVPITTVQIRLVRARRMLANRLSGKQNDKVPRT